MSVREYVGARYVPVFATPIDWNSANTYEPLTIVLHEGNSYTSRQAVPAGIQITNTAYWAQTGNYNAQIEQYRQDVAALASRFPVSVLDGGTGGTDAATARTNLDAAQADGATNTLYDAEQAIAANAADIISLQDSVDSSLRDNAINTISDIITPAENVTITAAEVHKVGRICMIKISCRTTVSRTNNDWRVGTFNQLYRPACETVLNAVCGYATFPQSLVAPDGNVYLRGPNGTSFEANSASYIWGIYITRT